MRHHAFATGLALLAVLTVFAGCSADAGDDDGEASAAQKKKKAKDGGVAEASAATDAASTALWSCAPGTGLIYVSKAGGSTRVYDPVTDTSTWADVKCNLWGGYGAEVFAVSSSGEAWQHQGPFNQYGPSYDIWYGTPLGQSCGTDAIHENIPGRFLLAFTYVTPASGPETLVGLQSDGGARSLVTFGADGVWSSHAPAPGVSNITGTSDGRIFAEKSGRLVRFDVPSVGKGAWGSPVEWPMTDVGPMPIEAPMAFSRGKLFFFERVPHYGSLDSARVRVFDLATKTLTTRSEIDLQIAAHVTSACVAP
ncbi:MAG: hypothetical protein U0235_10090 [Polyangiaceae bacterium]